MIEAGRYPAVVVPFQAKDGPQFCQFGESGAKKTPLVAVQFEILRGQYAGQRITWYGYFVDNADVTERTIKAIRACGFKGEDLAAMMFQEVDQEVSITVEHEEYNGKMRPKVAWVNPAGGGGLKVENQITGDRLKIFGAKLQSRLKSIPAMSGPKAQREEPIGRSHDAGGDQSSGFDPSNENQDDPNDPDRIPF